MTYYVSLMGGVDGSPELLGAMELHRDRYDDWVVTYVAKDGHTWQTQVAGSQNRISDERCSSDLGTALGESFGWWLVCQGLTQMGMGADHEAKE